MVVKLFGFTFLGVATTDTTKYSSVHLARVDAEDRTRHLYTLLKPDVHRLHHRIFTPILLEELLDQCTLLAIVHVVVERFFAKDCHAS